MKYQLETNKVLQEKSLDVLRDHLVLPLSASDRPLISATTAERPRVWPELSKDPLNIVALTEV